MTWVFLVIIAIVLLCLLFPFYGSGYADVGLNALDFKKTVM